MWPLPRSRRPCVAVTPEVRVKEEPRHSIGHSERIRARVGRAPRGAGKVRIVGSELREKRAIRPRPTASQDLTHRLRIEGEGWRAPLEIVGAGEIDLEADEAGLRVQPLDERQELFDRVPGDTHEDLRPTDVLFQPGQLVPNRARETGIGQAYRIKHPAGKLGDPGRRIPLTGLHRHRLGDEAPERLEVDDILELEAEAARPSGQEHRVLEVDSKGLGLEVHRWITSASRASRASSSSTTPAEPPPDAART